MEPAPPPVPRRPLIQVLIPVTVILLTRPLLVAFPQPISDVEIYARYAHEQELASRTGRNFYELHEERFRREVEAARQAGTLIGSVDEYLKVEYPPLALAVMRLPTLWMSESATDAGPTLSYLASYRAAYRVLMAAVDGLAFVLVWSLIGRVHRHENAGERSWRFLGYVLSTTALWPLLYERLDLMLALMMLLSFALLISKAHYGWSFAVLALGVNFKITPVVLLPLWLLGSLPVQSARSWFQPSVLAALVVRGVVLLGMLSAGFLPFYAREGSGVFGFLAYHRDRGLEVGSMYSSLLLALEPFGHITHVKYSFGSINLESSLSATLVALAPWVTGATLLAAIACFILRLRQLPAAVEEPNQETLAHRYPGMLAAFVLLFLLLFIAANKVFSPQYLLWVAPLVPLLPLRGPSQRLFMGAFLLICLLSTLLAPFLLVLDMVDPTAPPTLPKTSFVHPTLRVAVVLGMRNLLLLSFIAALAWRLGKNPFQPCSVPLPH
jgi:hypothetical protein